MAQTTGAFTGAAGRVEISANGTTWYDISGSTTMVDAGEQTRQSGEAYTLDGDTAIVTASKREPMEITVTGLYTEVALDTFEIVRAIHEGGPPARIHVRWVPEGGTDGTAFMFRTPTPNGGVLTGFTYPKVDSSDANPIPGGFKFKTPGVVKVTAADTTT